MSDERDEWLETAAWSWVVAWRGTVLHALESAEFDPEWYAAKPGVTVCGVKADLWLPGLFDRMGTPRCKRCCRKLGWPDGIGSPKNDKALRPLVEARMAA